MQLTAIGRAGIVGSSDEAASFELAIELTEGGTVRGRASLLLTCVRARGMRELGGIPAVARNGNDTRGHRAEHAERSHRWRRRLD